MRQGATHLAIRPGTDGVLAMGLARLLVEAGRHDERWLDAHAHGWPAFRERLADFPLDRVSEQTGIPAEQVRDLARLYADTRPGLIKIADGVNRNFNGGQNVRAILALPALTGQYGTRGGGLSYSTSGYVQWDAEAVHKRSLCPPPGRPVNMNRLGAALLGEAKDPPIRSLFVFGANPATSAVNAGRVVEGMKREDLFTVVHDLFMTDTAELADLVLPATSQLEQTDLHKAYGTTQLTYNAQAIAPLGESKSNWEVMGLLARAMGFDEPWLHQTPDEVIDEVLAATARDNPHFAGVTAARLRAEGHVSLAIPDEPPFAGGRFPTPSGKFEFHCEALAREGLRPAAGPVPRPRGRRRRRRRPGAGQPGVAPLRLEQPRQPGGVVDERRHAVRRDPPRRRADARHRRRRRGHPRQRARRVPVAGRRDRRGAARRRRLAEGALGQTVGRAQRQLADDGHARRHGGAGELPQYARVGAARGGGDAT